MKPAISVTNVSKKYAVREKQYYYALRDTLATILSNPLSSIKPKLAPEEFWALDDVNFEVQEGEILGLLGRNGAGKSTLLKILSRITPPTTGVITLRGRLGSLLEVGTGFHPELTARENIFLNGAILGMTRLEVKEAFDDIVTFAEVEQFLDTPLKHYSSGMYMRLAFAVASHLRSEILLVDEVLAVGDLEFQKKCLGKMELISKEGRTILFVSHNMSMMQQLCDRVLWLEKGKVKKVGKTTGIIQSYIRTFEGYNKVSIAQKVRSNEATLTAKIIDIALTQPTVSSSLIQSNKPIHITLQVEAYKTVNTGVWLAIKNERQETVCICSSGHLRNALFTFPEGQTQITCMLEAPQLASGRYSIEAGLLYPQREIVDLVSDALYFSVGAVDPYKAEFDLSQRFASVFVPHEWKV